jgi:transcription elongation factor Elf1
VKLVSYTCPACGARLNVGDARGFVTCEYCDTSFQIIDETPVARPYPEVTESCQAKEQSVQRVQANAKVASPNAKDSLRTGLFVLACLIFWPYMLVVLPFYAIYKAMRPEGMKFGAFCLWTYGWIIFFPIPLAILIMRRTKSKT